MELEKEKLIYRI